MMAEALTKPWVPSAPLHELATRTQYCLAAAAEADDTLRQALIDEVVTSHLWVADALARRYGQRGESHQDLVQVASVGLVEATQRFDVKRGAFMPFAVATMRGVLKRHFRDHAWSIRPSRQSQQLCAEIRREWSALAQIFGELPTARQVAARLGASVDAVREAQQASLGYVSAPLDPAAESSPGWTTDGDLDRLEARLVIAGLWKRMDESERELIRLRFFEQRSQAEIAALRGVSQMQVSRCLARLLAKLRGLVGATELLVA